MVFDRWRIYQHATARINFTTYDVRRDQDLINPRTEKSGILVFTPSEEGHPWAYARVLGIYHTVASIPGEVDAKRVEFLWVRWLQVDDEVETGSHLRCLPRVCYVPEDEPHAFGIVNPDHIVRGCHLIPAFHHGRVEEVLLPSVGRDTGGDWKFFYVNRYVLSFDSFTPPLMISLALLIET